MENEKLTYINSRGERLELGVDSVYHCNISKDVEGISGVTSVIYSTNSMGQHGDTYVGQRIEARDIDVVGHINTRDKAQALELRRRMLKIFNPELSATLVYEYGGFKRVIDCRAYGEPKILKKEVLYEFDLQIECLNPFWREEEETKEDIASWVAAWHFPCVIEKDSTKSMIYGYRAESVIVDCYNEGDVSTGMRIRFTALGTVSNPILLNVDTEEFIQINSTMKTGDVIEINTKYGSKGAKLIRDGVETDYFRYIDVDSTFMQLAIVGYITDKDGRRITLLEAMGDYGNVQKAYNKARKCKRHRKDVLIFTKDKEENLDKVREDIINLAYEPSKYHYFKVYEPKERQIMALPFYDRVVQHAINNVLEPIFDKRFISQSYACRKGKGMHAASDTLKEWLYEWNKYHPDQPLYAIKADIHHYFQSIDHAVLKTEIRKVIKDAGVLALLDRIIDHNGNMPDGVGIPVGNLTSQLFANIYLDALDQFIKHELGVEAYIRYMDDFVILSPDKEQLRNWLARIEQFLREELKLEFNPKTTMLAAKNGIDFVGYKHRATHRKVRKDSIKRIKRTIKKCESGKITKEQLQKSIQSWTGHAGHADSYNLRKKIETLAEAAIEKAA